MTDLELKQNETWFSLLDYGMTEADIGVFMDAIIRGDIKHVSIDWWKK